MNNENHPPQTNISTNTLRQYKKIKKAFAQLQTLSENIDLSQEFNEIDNEYLIEDMTFKQTVHYCQQIIEAYRENPNHDHVIAARQSITSYRDDKTHNDMDTCNKKDLVLSQTYFVIDDVLDSSQMSSLFVLLTDYLELIQKYREEEYFDKAVELLPILTQLSEFIGNNKIILNSVREIYDNTKDFWDDMEYRINYTESSCLARFHQNNNNFELSVHHYLKEASLRQIKIETNLKDLYNSKPPLKKKAHLLALKEQFLDLNALLSICLCALEQCVTHKTNNLASSIKSYCDFCKTEQEKIVKQNKNYFNNKKNFRKESSSLQQAVQQGLNKIYKKGAPNQSLDSLLEDIEKTDKKKRKNNRRKQKNKKKEILHNNNNESNELNKPSIEIKEDRQSNNNNNIVKKEIKKRKKRGITKVIKHVANDLRKGGLPKFNINQSRFFPSNNNNLKQQNKHLIQDRQRDVLDAKLKSIEGLLFEIDNNLNRANAYCYNTHVNYLAHPDRLIQAIRQQITQAYNLLIEINNNMPELAYREAITLKFDELSYYQQQVDTIYLPSKQVFFFEHAAQVTVQEKAEHLLARVNYHLKLASIAKVKICDDSIHNKDIFLQNFDHELGEAVLAYEKVELFLKSNPHGSNEPWVQMVEFRQQIKEMNKEALSLTY